MPHYKWYYKVPCKSQPQVIHITPRVPKVTSLHTFNTNKHTPRSDLWLTGEPSVTGLYPACWLTPSRESGLEIALSPFPHFQHPTQRALKGADLPQSVSFLPILLARYDKRVRVVKKLALLWTPASFSLRGRARDLNYPPAGQFKQPKRSNPRVNMVNDAQHGRARVCAKTRASYQSTWACLSIASEQASGLCKLKPPLTVPGRLRCGKRHSAAVPLCELTSTG